MYIIGKQTRVADARGAKPITMPAPNGMPPIHASLEAAEQEAKRLILATPTHDFLIFQAVARVGFADVPVTVEKIEA